VCIFDKVKEDDLLTSGRKTGVLGGQIGITDLETSSNWNDLVCSPRINRCAGILKPGGTVYLNGSVHPTVTRCRVGKYERRSREGVVWLAGGGGVNRLWFSI